MGSEKNTFSNVIKLFTRLSFPVIIFLVVIILLSIYFSLQPGSKPETIAEKVQNSVPSILLYSQILLLLYFVSLKRSNRLSWQDLGWKSETLLKDIIIGGLFGAVLATLYFLFIADLQTMLQKQLGDYVPPGVLLSSFGSSNIQFFFANVILAPFVEENFYRGYAMYKLKQLFSIPVTFILSCIFFGLLHWAGGFWYIVITGVFAGGMFCTLLIWRKNIIAPFISHFVLNVIEYIYITTI